MAPRFVEVAELPVPAELATVIRSAMKLTGETPTSVYRGSDPQGVAILNRYGHHSQAQLYDASPGQRAAWGVIGQPDRPGTSTHELRSDGVAFPGPAGRVLPGYECGQDWPNDSIARVMEAYRRLGELPIHPYASGLEYHHICLTRAPKVPYRTIRQGNVGWGVLAASGMLRDCGYLGRAYWRFKVPVTAAVEAFQRHHHLQVDGIIGQHTYLQLQAAARACRKTHRKEKP